MELPYIDIPLEELTEPDRTPVAVTAMEHYAGIYFYIEYPILLYWKKHPHLKDKKVISVFKKLIKNFDHHKGSSLEGIISRAVKAELLRSKVEEGRIYTYGEVISCVRLLKNIAKTHRSSNGRGYLHWVETFFVGKLPETKEEIKEYILKYER